MSNYTPFHLPDSYYVQPDPDEDGAALCEVCGRAVMEDSEWSTITTSDGEVLGVCGKCYRGEQ